MNTAPERRMARRMTHRSRSVWVCVALAAFVIAAVVVIVEAARAGLGLPVLWLSLPEVWAQITGGGPVGIAVAIGAALAGILCVWGALSPGRTGRRIITADRAPIVVDDAIVAGTLSRGAARRASVGASHVATRVSRRRADVRITPATGFPVAGTEIARAENEALAPVDLTPPVTVRVRVEDGGRLS